MAKTQQRSKQPINSLAGLDTNERRKLNDEQQKAFRLMEWR